MSSDEASKFAPGTEYADDLVHDARVDVLVLTALKDELAAVLGLGQTWTEVRDADGFPYHRCSLPSSLGGELVVAAAWIGEMGQRAAAVRGQTLLHELEPECLAMCGICAGDPEQVSLGDIVVANQLWPYDEGKQAEAGFYHSMKLFQMERTWGMDAAFAADWIDIKTLAQGRPPSKEAQTRWLLHTMYAHQFDNGPVPADHPERKVHCPRYADVLKEAITNALVIRQGRALTLTDIGKDRVDEDALIHPDGVPPDPDFRIHIGAMATGSAVIEDAGIFRRLRRINRDTMALDMEGAAIAELAERAGKRFLVVKAVQDYANGQKDNTFRAFGCRAAAKFLTAFLTKNLLRRAVVSTARENRRSDEFDNDYNDKFEPFLLQVERPVMLQHRDARIMRRLTPAPFAGLLEVQTDRNGYYELELVAALNMPISTELLERFARNVEPPYRIKHPRLRSTLVHQGETAPRSLRDDAYRRGITLRTFREYQGLFDLTKYLEWQTDWLARDKSDEYRADIYVKQAARIQVSGHREWSKTDDLLQTLWDHLATPNERHFVLVLGEFGAGKTFLLRQLCRRMAQEKHPVWPVLVEMRKLEKRHDLAELLGAHFGRADVPGYNYKAFQYMLETGRIALFFDGFDELADRVTYDTATQHFETVLQAAQGGAAKVLVSSRTQHFLTDNQAKLALAEQARSISAHRIVVIEPFGEMQIRGYLTNVLVNAAAADARYRLIDEVHDLLGLSHNPRMLAFIAHLPEKDLREAKAQDGTITAAGLYARLVKYWLDEEYKRLLARGAAKGMTRQTLDDGITALAVSMWRARTKSVEKDTIRDILVSAGIARGEPTLDPDVITHLFGSGSLLVRDAVGIFSFVHGSVLEWLVAKSVAAEIAEWNDPVILAENEMSPLMADFFTAMATRAHAVAWSRERLETGAEGHLNNNATLILTRLGESLARLNFEGHDLRGRNFAGVDWRGANLQGANLEGATLVGADLSGASLAGARLVRANMAKAKLVGAYLNEADFYCANLLGANLEHAVNFDPEKFHRVKLVGAKNVPQALMDALPADAAPPNATTAERMEMPTAAISASLVCRPIGDIIAAGQSNRTVSLIDSATGQFIRVLDLPIDKSSFGPNSPRRIAFSRDGDLVTADAAPLLPVWALSSGKLLHAFSVTPKPYYLIAIMDDRETMVACASTKSMFKFNVRTGSQIPADDFDGVPIAISPRRCVTVGTNEVRVLNNETFTVCSRFRVAKSSGMCVTILPGEKTLCWWQAADAIIELRDLETATLLGHVDVGQAIVSNVAFSSDGAKLAVGIHDGSVAIWNFSVTRAERVFEGYARDVTRVVFTNDSKTLLSAGRDMTIRFWNVETGEQIRVLKGHEGSGPRPHWYVIGLCRFEPGELDEYIPIGEPDLESPADVDSRQVHPPTSPVRQEQPLPPLPTDTRLLASARIALRRQHEVGDLHRRHWLARLKPSPQRAVLARFDEWLKLCEHVPAIKPHTRHDDFADRPARISLMGETILRATGLPGKDGLASAFHLDDAALETICADLVAATYAIQLDRAIDVVLSREDLPQEARHALSKLLELPADPIAAADYFGRLARLLPPPYNELPAHPSEQQTPRGLSLAGLALDVWKLPKRVAEAIIAVTCPTRMPVVRITPDNPLPGLLVLCRALQLWKRPVVAARRHYIELWDLLIDGLDDAKPGERHGIHEKLVFRLDWGTDALKLGKSHFDDAIVRSTMHTALDRLRIATNAFPDIRVELRFPGGNETIEVLREAEPASTTSTSIVARPIVSAKPSTWTELSTILETAGDIDALRRLKGVLTILPPEEAAAAQDLLRKLVSRTDLPDDVRLEAADLLTVSLYNEPSDEARAATADVFLAFATQSNLVEETCFLALTKLLDILAGLPFPSAAHVAETIERAAQTDSMPATLKSRAIASLRRHARRAEARNPKSVASKSKSK